MMDKNSIARAFNAWMDDYINDPDSFEKIGESAHAHLQQKLEGKEPTYGDVCAELLQRYATRTRHLESAAVVDVEGTPICTCTMDGPPCGACELRRPDLCNG